MKVRAKFVCNAKVQIGEGYEVTLDAVTDGSAENEEFFDATPGGQLEMGILNEQAADAFEVGKEYYLDFTPADG